MPERYSPGELLRSHLWTVITSLSQRLLRDFGGYGVGIRRKMHAVEPMATEVAKTIGRYMLVRYRGGELQSAEICRSVIAVVLQNISDEDAYSLCRHNYETQKMTVEAMASFLEGCFQFELRPRDDRMSRTSFTNGWKAWETVGQRELKYKWRHSWTEKDGEDFVAFHNERQIGRIYRVFGSGDNLWYWIVATEGGRRSNWPSAGVEESPYLASRRLEFIYDAISSGKSRAER